MGSIPTEVNLYVLPKKKQIPYYIQGFQIKIKHFLFYLFLGDTTAKYRWFAIVYMIVMFIVLPAVFMGLSFAGSVYVIIVASIICFVFLFVSGVNLILKKKPSLLPKFLQVIYKPFFKIEK